MTAEQIKDAYTLAELRAMGNQLVHLFMRAAEHLEEIASLQAARDDLAQRVKDLEARRDHWMAAERRVSDGYVRLRQIIGAMNPPALDWDSLSQYVEGVARSVIAERDELQKLGTDQAILALDSLSKASDLQAENEELKAKLEKIERLILSE